jgi:hypothetical protein
MNEIKPLSWFNFKTRSSNIATGLEKHRIATLNITRGSLRLLRCQFATKRTKAQYVNYGSVLARRIPTLYS